jgi:chitinase
VSGSTLSYTHNGLIASSLYSYTVLAKDAAGNVSNASNTITVTTDGTSNGGEAPAWQTNTAYKVGDEVTYNGVVYICRQAHTSLAGWEPSNVPALWQVK